MTEKYNKIYKLGLLLMMTIAMGSCEDFLDAKPEKNLVVPRTVQDLQALLESVVIFNTTPALDIIAADEYYNTDQGWASYNNHMVQQAHLRNFKKIYEGNSFVADWAMPYEQVYNANLCLEFAENITTTTSEEKTALDNVIGTSLFVRGFAFHNLIKNFGEGYNSATAQTNQGIPLPLGSDVTIFYPFSNLEEAYKQTVADLEASLIYLPDLPLYKSRPSRASAYAMLARVYLSMGDYENAMESATACLQIQDKLLDFNTINPAALYPIPRANEEVIYHAEAVNYASFPRSVETKVDTVLLRSFEENDLRSQAFFNLQENGSYNFKGFFTGGPTHFTGLAVSEVLLIRAECAARTGQLGIALQDLNRLLESRWKLGMFVPLESESQADILKMVLNERHKDLLFRGLRWTDIKRLVIAGEWQDVLVRRLNGETFAFDPRTENMAFPIPEDEIQNR